VSGEIPTLPTRIGHAEWGDNRLRGYSVGRDLAGRESTTGLFVLSIVGRRLNENERLMLDDLAVVANVADPRIWPLKLVRVVAAFGGRFAAMAAATVCLEGAQIAEASAGRAADILVELHHALLAEGTDPWSADEWVFEKHCRSWLAERSRPVGFHVPFRPRDERVDLLAERVAARGRSELNYWRLFAKVTEAFFRIGNMRPNIMPAAGAVCLDMGFTPRQIGPLMMAIGSSAYWANAVEGAEQSPVCLQMLPETCLRYVGRAPRRSPRAGGERSSG
jgi:hypothetical protein